MKNNRFLIWYVYVILVLIFSIKLHDNVVLDKVYSSKLLQSTIKSTTKKESKSVLSYISNKTYNDSAEFLYITDLGVRMASSYMKNIDLNNKNISIKLSRKVKDLNINALKFLSKEKSKDKAVKFSIENIIELLEVLNQFESSPDLQSYLIDLQVISDNITEENCEKQFQKAISKVIVLLEEVDS